jgi:nitrite reductase (NO-forming)
MNHRLSPTNWTAAVLIGCVVLFFAVFPVSIEIQPQTTSAQDEPTVEYTLRTALRTEAPPMAFVGVGGEIDGVVNPELHATVGDVVKITVINGDPVLHDMKIDEFDVSTGELITQNQEAVVIFKVTEAGEYVYYCSVPGHREIGMWGKLIVTGPNAESQTAAEPLAGAGQWVIRNPADLPGPIGDRGPTTVQVNLTTEEVTAQLADGTTYSFFTFNGQVPGPMLRVRVGDTIELNLENLTSSAFPHSIDLHAVTGPGGGAVFTQTNPGDTTSFTFQALNPGLYVYHCATPSVAHHIAAGMYGLILVEPEGGLPPVDREFYVMQGEIYTTQPIGTGGHLDFDHSKMLNEAPEYVILNGAANALTLDDYVLHANVGETVRIYFGVGGPNLTSSFHVIGEIFDRVYSQASLTSAPLTDVQTTTVPPGGAAMVEFKVEVPGQYILVDHALSRLERGLAGYLRVEGEENPQIFVGHGPVSMAGH